MKGSTNASLISVQEFKDLKIASQGADQEINLLKQTKQDKMLKLALTGTIENEIAVFSTNVDLENNTFVRFILSIDDAQSSTPIKLIDSRTNTELYLITPYNTGPGVSDIDRPTIANFSQTNVITKINTTTISFIALVDIDANSTVKLIVNEDDLTDILQRLDNVPTRTSDLTNDGDGQSQFVTEDFLDDSYITRARIKVLFNETFSQGGDN